MQVYQRVIIAGGEQEGINEAFIRLLHRFFVVFYKEVIMEGDKQFHARMLGLVLIGMVFFSASAHADPLVQETGRQLHVGVWENRVVYADSRDLEPGESLNDLDANVDIFLYNTGTGVERQITTDSNRQTYPSIWGDRIVYDDTRNFASANLDIYMYDLETGTEHRISNNIADQFHPSIWEDRIVYRDNRNGKWNRDIYMYDLSTGTERQITTDTSDQYLTPLGRAIWGDIIVYSDLRNGTGNLDIYMYDLAENEESPICTHVGNQTYPSVWEERIVWEDTRNGNKDIYMYDLSTNRERAICTDPDDQHMPVIHEDRILWWEGWENAGSETMAVYMYDLVCESETEVFPSGNHQSHPNIWGDRIVWEEESDLHTVVCEPRRDMAVVLSDSPDPVRAGFYVQYSLSVNNGADPATGIVVTNQLPESATLISVAVSKGEYTLADQEITWNIAEMDRDEEAAATVVVQTSTQGTLTNYAEVAAVEPDCYPDNNSFTEETEVLPADAWITEVIGSGDDPCLKVDAAGHAHIAFTDYENNEIRHVSNIAGNWVDRTVAGSDDLLQSPAIALDAAGTPHIAYARFSPAGYTLYYTHKASEAWSSPEAVAEGLSDCGSIALAVDSTHAAHIIYLQGMWGSPLSYATNKTGAWVSETLHPDVYNHAAMAVDADGYAHVAFYSWEILPETTEREQGPGYVTNAPDGTWSQPEVIQPEWLGGQMEGMKIDIATDSANTPHAFFAGSKDDFNNEDHLYATKVSGQWQVQIIEEGDFGSAGRAICIDDKDQVHFSYRNPLSNRLMYGRLDQGSMVHKAIDTDGGWLNDLAAASGKACAGFSRGSDICYAQMPLEPDSDFDGISDPEENAGPNSGDGNVDGTPDMAQSEVTSFLSADRQHYLTLSSSNGSVLSAVDAVDCLCGDGVPASTAFPFGWIAFTLYGWVENGQPAWVDLHLHSAAPDAYYQYGPVPSDPSDHCYVFDYDGESGASIGSPTVLYFVDGLRGDQDISENGIIMATGGPAALETEPDADGDGVSDDQDVFPNDPDEWLDTDSDGIGNNADTDDDGDGMPDDWEARYDGLDPLVDDADEDMDGDGVSNHEEYNAGTDPTEPPESPNTVPEKPVLQSPADNAAAVSLTAELRTEAFADPDASDTHGSTQWQISNDHTFSINSMVLDITSDTCLTAMTVPVSLLTGDRAYYWRTRFFDNHNAASVWSDAFDFTTLTSIADADGNGIPDTQEDPAMDLDNNGTPDIDQADIKSLKTAVGGGQIGVKQGMQVTSIDSLAAIDPAEIADTANKPASLPLGLISFKVQVANAGDTAAVIIYLSEPASGAWYKYDTLNGWQDYTDHAAFSADGTEVTLELKDGSYGDADGVANGVIVDPSGFGTTPEALKPSGDGGCFITESMRK